MLRVARAPGLYTQEAETRVPASPFHTTGSVKRLLPTGSLNDRPILAGFGTRRPRFSHEPGVSRHIHTSTAWGLFPRSSSVPSRGRPGIAML